MATLHPNAVLEAQVAGVPTDLIWRMTLAKYHEMVRTGALTENDPVEFLEGWLVYRMPKNRPHSLATNRTYKKLEQFVPTEWHVESQEPITLDDSEPEPDVIVVRGSAEDYPNRHPGPEDVAMLVEVADSTLERDRGWKKRLYAKAGIPIYWILNLVDHQIEVYTEPTGQVKNPDYAKCEIYSKSQTIPLVIAGRTLREISVQDILP